MPDAEYYKANKERLLIYNREWRSANKEYDRIRKQIDNIVNRDKCEKRHREWKKNNPEKYKARLTFFRALYAGVIKRQPCIICGSNNSQGHHPDYNKPLEVIWLCQLHHSRVHRAN